MILLDNLDRRPLVIPPGHTIATFEVIEPPRLRARRGSVAKSAIVSFVPWLDEPSDPLLNAQELPE
jgi:hypothetical protein